MAQSRRREEPRVYISISWKWSRDCALSTTWSKILVMTLVVNSGAAFSFLLLTTQSHA
jgi:hypothetical protein